jgi:hypothetical protein
VIKVMQDRKDPPEPMVLTVPRAPKGRKEKKVIKVMQDLKGPMVMASNHLRTMVMEPIQ